MSSDSKIKASAKRIKATKPEGSAAEITLTLKKQQFVEEMAKRHAGGSISYDDFRRTAVPVFNFWEDRAYQFLYQTFQRLRLFEELALLYPTSPCTYGEFVAAAARDVWAEPTLRRGFTKFNTRMRAQWRAAESGDVDVFRVYPPYSGFLKVLSEATGLRNHELVHHLIGHYAALILGQRVDVVDSIVTSSLLSGEEIALVERLLKDMDFSDDPRIANIDQQRVEKRRRRQILSGVLGG